MLSDISIITTPSADTPGTTLLLQCDKKKYVFGQIGEGTQRAFMERNVGIRQVNNLFITGECNWHSSGGLLGMILTLADARESARKQMVIEREEKKRRYYEKFNELEKKNAERVARGKKPEKITLAPVKDDPVENTPFEIWGPPNLMHTVATARRFIFRKGLPLRIHEVTERQDRPADDPAVEAEWPPTWQDDHIRVWSMCVRSEHAPKSQVRPGTPLSDPCDATSNPLGAKKRSFDEAIGFEPMMPNLEIPRGVAENSLSSVAETIQDTEEQWVRENVVAQMFGSDWTLDKLDEIPLSQVKLPAKLFVRDGQTKDLKLYAGPLPGGAVPVPDINVFVRRPWPGALIQSLPPTQPKEEAVSYIIGLPPRRGKFDIVKAKATKVAPKDYSKLTSGQSVILEDGTVVKPEDVLGESQTGAGVAIIDLPSEKFVKSLIQRPEWRSPIVMKGVESIVWILGPSVVTNPDLLAFMHDLKDMHHFVSSPDLCRNDITFNKAGATIINLNQINSEYYPVPIFGPHLDPLLPSGPTFGRLESLPSNAEVASKEMTLTMEPRYSMTKTPIADSLDLQQLVDAFPVNVKELVQEQFALQQMGALAEWQSSLPRPDTEIISLGTGSSLPSRHRNVSGTLVRVPGWGNYLLDSGEGTLGQIRRMYSAAEVVDIFKNLRMLWISHLHADHHLGAVNILRTWYTVNHGNDATASSKAAPISSQYLQTLLSNQAITTNGKQSTLSQDALRNENRSPYLAVVSDIQFMHYLSEYSSVENFGYSHILPLAITSARPNNSDPTSSELRLSHRGCAVQKVPSSLLPELLGLQDIQACDVKHCHGAKGLAMTWPLDLMDNKEPLKISYSGDCRPSANLAAIGKGSTLIIHEATFDDDLKGEARAKNHSTTSEALDIGRRMGAKAAFLTHFSQRYNKIPGAEWSKQPPSKATDEEIEMEQRDVATDALPGWGEVGQTDQGLDDRTSQSDPSSLPQNQQFALEEPDDNRHGKGTASRDATMIDAPDEKSTEIKQALSQNQSQTSELEHLRTMEDPSMKGIVHSDLPPSVITAADNTESSSVRPSTANNSLTLQAHLSLADEPAVNVETAQQWLEPQNNVPASISGPQMEKYGIETQDVTMKICVAFDYMRVKIKDIGRMQLLRPALVKLFEALEARDEELKSQRVAAIEAEHSKNKASKDKKKGAQTPQQTAPSAA